jgi:glycosyltransferase involved in cell wall biosynthesis
MNDAPEAIGYAGRDARGATERRGTVFARPGRSNRKANPYNFLLSEALARQGWLVLDQAEASSYATRPDIVHFHWPESAAGLSWPSTVKRIAEVLSSALWQKRRGAKLVWTVHNPSSHDHARPRLERFYMARFVALLDGAIYLSRSTRERALELHPGLREVPAEVIPHHLYGDEYPPPRAQPAAAAGSRGRLGVVGDLKAYKGIDDLTRRFAEATFDDVELEIWGRFADPAFRARMIALTRQAQARGAHIGLTEGRLDNQQFVDAIASCDAVALPYSNDANSGVAILAAELGVPLLTSPSAALRELREEIGHPGSGEIDPAAGAAALRELVLHARAAGKRGPSEAFTAARDVDAVAARTGRFYERLLAA